MDAKSTAKTEEGKVEDIASSSLAKGSTFIVKQAMAIDLSDDDEPVLDEARSTFTAPKKTVVPQKRPAPPPKIFPKTKKPQVVSKKVDTSAACPINLDDSDNEVEEGPTTATTRKPIKTRQPSSTSKMPVNGSSAKTPKMRKPVPSTPASSETPPLPGQAPKLITEESKVARSTVQALLSGAKVERAAIDCLHKCVMGNVVTAADITEEMAASLSTSSAHSQLSIWHSIGEAVAEHPEALRALFAPSLTNLLRKYMRPTSNTATAYQSLLQSWDNRKLWHSPSDVSLASVLAAKIVVSGMLSLRPDSVTFRKDLQRFVALATCHAKHTSTVVEDIIQTLCDSPAADRLVVWKAIDALASTTYAFMLQPHVERLLETHAPPYTPVFARLLEKWACSQDVFQGSQEQFRSFLSKYKLSRSMPNDVASPRQEASPNGSSYSPMPAQAQETPLCVTPPAMQCPDEPSTPVTPPTDKDQAVPTTPPKATLSTPHQTVLALTHVLSLYLQQHIAGSATIEGCTGVTLAFQPDFLVLSGPPGNVTAAEAAIRRQLEGIATAQHLITPAQHECLAAKDILQKVSTRTETSVHLAEDRVHVAGPQLHVETAIKAIKKFLTSISSQPQTSTKLIELSQEQLHATLLLAGPRLQSLRKRMAANISVQNNTVTLSGLADALEIAEEEFLVAIQETQSSVKTLKSYTVLVRGVNTDTLEPQLKEWFPTQKLVQNGWMEIGDKEVLVPFEHPRDVMSALNVHNCPPEVSVVPNPLNLPTLSSQRPSTMLTPPVLLVGEGNFTFSLALAAVLGSGAEIVATTDETPIQLSKHLGGDDELNQLKEKLQLAGIKLLWEIDATSLVVGMHKFSATPTTLRGESQFAHLVFNFPETPHTRLLGLDSEDIEAEANRVLLGSFFRTGVRMLRDHGLIHVTLNDTSWYRRWNVMEIATESGLQLHHVQPFFQDEWPGYRPVHTNWQAVTKEEIKDAYVFTFAEKSDTRHSPSAAAYLYPICVKRTIHLNAIPCDTVNKLLHLTSHDAQIALKAFGASQLNDTTAAKMLTLFINARSKNICPEPHAALWHNKELFAPL